MDVRHTEHGFDQIDGSVGMISMCLQRRWIRRRILSERKPALRRQARLAVDLHVTDRDMPRGRRGFSWSFESVDGAVNDSLGGEPAHGGVDIGGAEDQDVQALEPGECCGHAGVTYSRHIQV